MSSHSLLRHQRHEVAPLLFRVASSAFSCSFLNARHLFSFFFHFFVLLLFCLLLFFFLLSLSSSASSSLPLNLQWLLLRHRDFSRLVLPTVLLLVVTGGKGRLCLSKASCQICRMPQLAQRYLLLRPRLILLAFSFQLLELLSRLPSLCFHFFFNTFFFFFKCFFSLFFFKF